MTFEPRTGVATETSPRLKARKVKIWPTKKTGRKTAVGRTLGKFAGGGVGTNKNGKKIVACPEFGKKFPRHGPAPSVPRLSINAATAYPGAEQSGTSMGEAND